MGLTHDERQARDDFSHRYSTGARVLDEIEQRVIGAVWGANGYTTVDEADRLISLLALTRSSRLLDIGSGRGWPGLYLAQQTGCEVVVTDLPVEGLQVAAKRARGERISLVGAVSSSARDLPFRSGVFDAITHTDVLC